MDLIKIAEEAFATGKQHPSFKAGDTVTVAYRIIEGNKERVQLYRGVMALRFRKDREFPVAAPHSAGIMHLI